MWSDQPVASEPPIPSTGAGGFTFDHYHNFDALLIMSRAELLSTLATVHADVANITEQVAFCRAQEVRLNERNPDRIVLEGSRDALNEKKWLILKLLEK